MKPRQIIAIGGQGFAKPGRKPFFEPYILAQTSAKNPRICFLGTATGDSPKYIERFYETFSRLRCRPSHIPLFARTPDLRKILMSQDAIFVGGGNTKSMLAVWHEWGIDKILKEAWKKGIVLSGTSAGAICWFEEGVTDSWEGKLMPLKCLGFLKGSCCPHWSGEKERKPSYKKMLKAGKIRPGIAIDDGAGVHYLGQKLQCVIHHKNDVGAYRMNLRKGRLQEGKVYD
ncbi:MAG: peptidase E [Candidatus Peribacteraceae bacterium]|nr:peptidase E [Candidatus Peribacteraceae bacterium]